MAGLMEFLWHLEVIRADRINVPETPKMGCAMVCRVTDDVINALQHCRLKAYFRLHAEAGVQCGYEKLLIEQRANVQNAALPARWAWSPKNCRRPASCAASSISSIRRRNSRDSTFTGRR